MPLNLELKAKVPDLKAAEKVARRLKARKTSLLFQTDTYFTAPAGRLKLREINGKRFELIYYKRANRKGSRYSEYLIVPLQEPQIALALLSKLFEKRVVVRKKRILYLYRNSRIHLDKVNGLGSFIEFEVLVRKEKHQAQELMRKLMSDFGIIPKMIVKGSYSDLLVAGKKRQKR